MSKKTRKFLEKKFEKELEIAKEKAVHGQHEIIIILDHLKGGFNIGKILRSCEIYSVHEVHIVGTKFFDVTIAKGALKRVKTFFYDNIEDSIERINELGYTPLTLDSNAQTFLNESELPKKSAFIFGHEEFGPLKEMPGIERLKIKQYGMTESLNVSIAASIVMYEYTNQHASE
ncbi:TrmH family RNA methyltransferase [Oceanospirillum sp. RT-1-3]|uniref:TrmH family RNA methyltransferase n=1 Tax=unclassified Halobacteriovorax TaxID=2639665 RepID=UPI00399B9F2E